MNVSVARATVWSFRLHVSEFNALRADKLVLASDEPSKPGNVELVDWDKDHADLKWTKPESDGGAPITGYVIEFKVRSLTTTT